MDNRLGKDQQPLIDLRAPLPHDGGQDTSSVDAHSGQEGNCMTVMPPSAPRPRRILRFIVAAVIVLGAAVASSQVMVPAGQAMVVTRLGDPLRVLTHPGLAWKLPMPIDSVIPVDLRLHTTSGGLQDVGTRDGLRILVQAYCRGGCRPTQSGSC